MSTPEPSDESVPPLADQGIFPGADGPLVARVLKAVESVVAQVHKRASAITIEADSQPGDAEMGVLRVRMRLDPERATLRELELWQRMGAVPTEFFAQPLTQEPRRKFEIRATRQAVGELRMYAHHLAQGPAKLTASQLDHVLDIVMDVLNVGGVGLCKVCDRAAPLYDGECPDCRH